MLIPVSPSSLREAKGAFIKTNAFIIGTTDHKTASIFQLPILKIEKNNVEIKTTPICPQQ